jgi:hypothetical protein
MTLTLGALQRKRDEALWLTTRTPIQTPAEAVAFLKKVGMALRYGPARNLPLASIYRAASASAVIKGAPVRAIELTNHLLGSASAIEVNVIADRLTLVHRSLMPALYALVRRGRTIDDLTGIGMNGRAAFALIRQRREVTAGDVRQHLALRFDPQVDPGYSALDELKRVLLVDRGPFEIRKSGIPYLSQEGYPNHFFHEAHPDLVRAAGKLSVAEASDAFVQRYLDGAIFCAVRTFKAMFKRFLMKEEIDETIERLTVARKISVQKINSQTVAISGPT